PLGREARAHVDVDLPQPALARIHEPVRLTGRDQDDVAGGDVLLLVAVVEGRLSLEDDQHLLVRVRVQRGPTARLRVDADHAAPAAVVGADELVGDLAPGERVLAQHPDAQTPGRPDSSNCCTLSEIAIPGRSPGDGSGSPNPVTIGTTPAHVSRSASSVSSSS